MKFDIYFDGFFNNYEKSQTVECDLLMENSDF